MDNSETATQQSLNIREERNCVVASLVGRQAPLGATGNEGPVLLRNETSPNRGRTTTRQVVGNVNMEHVSPQEGRDDSYVRNPAPRHHVRSGVQRRNVHLGSFTPQHNDPSMRFQSIVARYESMNRLSNAITQSLVPRRSVSDIAREYHDVLILMQNAPTEYHDFFRNALSLLNEEINTLSNQTNSNSNNGSNNSAQQNHRNSSSDN